MFDIGWAELMVIGVVALVVIGPKDLPVMFQALGRFTAKARSMAREFSRAMEDAAKESGINEATKDLKGLASPKSLGLDKVQQAVGKFEAWDPLKKSVPTVKGGAVKGSVAGAPAAATSGAGAAAVTTAPAASAAAGGSEAAAAVEGAGTAESQASAAPAPAPVPPPPGPEGA